MFIFVHGDEFDSDDDVEIDSCDCVREEFIVINERGTFFMLKKRSRFARFCVSLSVTNVQVL